MLSYRQEMYVSNYLRNHCSNPLASRAMGIPPSAGSKILKDRIVVAEIRRRLRAHADQTKCTVENVLAELAKIAFHDPSKVFEHRRERCSYCWPADVLDMHPNSECQRCQGEGVGRLFLRDTRTLGPAESAAISAIEESEHGIKVKLSDKKAALELIAKHLGMFVERVQLSATEGTGVLLVPAQLTVEQWQAKAKAMAAPPAA